MSQEMRRIQVGLKSEFLPMGSHRVYASPKVYVLFTVTCGPIAEPRERRKAHPKKSGTSKICFLESPFPPSRISLRLRFSYIFKERTQPEHKEFQGLSKAPTKVELQELG